MISRLRSGRDEENAAKPGSPAGNRRSSDHPRLATRDPVTTVCWLPVGALAVAVRLPCGEEDRRR